MMKLFLIRHAESEHNVKRAFAGVTDSALTKHGSLQIDRLAQHFRSQGLQFSKIFSSDLRRARTTAEALDTVSNKEQSSAGEPVNTVVLLEALREKDFGSLEGQSWVSRAKATRNQGPKDQESHSSMETRARAFLNENILPLLSSNGTEGQAIAVVSHGIILSVIWRCLSSLFSPQAINTAAGVDNIGNMPAWSNTGFLELEIKQLTIASSPSNTPGFTQCPSRTKSPEPPPTPAIVDALPGWQMKILTVNGQHHVSTLKRTRGGLGSSRHDKRQKQIDSFFMKPKAGD
ncbi:hypothetical protein FQN54_005237 [Arachnomyces sp. PD_36]|nr:hypothetical protein FQN54_005237 [Arachnomyces sp. PD_36]